MKNADIQIRSMVENDSKIISEAFEQQGWHKPISQYERYFQEQCKGQRKVIIATVKGSFVGYATLVWNSGYGLFKAHGIPEIVDLNVLIAYRKQGVATCLIEAIEDLVAKTHLVIGIAVGLIPDYGAAQRLYVKLGYVPDGLGISKHNNWIGHGDTVVADDDLILCLTKTLSRH